MPEEQTPEENSAGSKMEHTDTFKTEMDKPTPSEQVEHLTAENLRLKEENEKLRVMNESFILHNISLTRDIETQMTANKDLRGILNSKEIKQSFNP